MRYHLALLLLAVVSCAPPHPLDMGYHGSDDGYVKALMAAYAWNSTCDANLIEVHRGDGDTSVIEQEGLWGGLYYGVTIRERPILDAIGPKEPVRIVFMRGEHALPTLAHEFGHALGLEHEPTGIMRPGVDQDALEPDGLSVAPKMIAEDCARVR